MDVSDWEMRWDGSERGMCILEKHIENRHSALDDPSLRLVERKRGFGACTFTFMVVSTQRGETVVDVSECVAGLGRLGKKAKLKRMATALFEYLSASHKIESIVFDEAAQNLGFYVEDFHDAFEKNKRYVASKIECSADDVSYNIVIGVADFGMAGRMKHALIAVHSVVHPGEEWNDFTPVFDGPSVSLTVTDGAYDLYLDPERVTFAQMRAIIGALCGGDEFRFGDPECGGKSFVALSGTDALRITLLGPGSLFRVDESGFVHSSIDKDLRASVPRAWEETILGRVPADPKIKKIGICIRRFDAVKSVYDAPRVADRKMCRADADVERRIKYRETDETYELDFDGQLTIADVDEALVRLAPPGVSVDVATEKPWFKRLF
jgi:hypothetical protein